MTPEEKVERAAYKAARAREALDEIMREARQQGVPLRRIAVAANLSPESVRQRTFG